MKCIFDEDIIGIKEYLGLIKKHPEVSKFNDLYQLIPKMDKESLDDIAGLCSSLIKRIRQDKHKRQGIKTKDGWPDWLYKPLRAYRVESSLIDHRREVRDDKGQQFFFSEPYLFGMESVAELIEFCKKEGFTFCVDAGRATHFPAETVAVILYRKALNGPNLTLP